MAEKVPSWAPDDVDVTKASVARMYDYVLGGAHNFESDRTVIEGLIARQPGVRDIAIRNRAFLGRAVRYLVNNGIRQFLDLGSGIPTAGNVHEVAQQLAPGTRVVYVDYEQVAYTHSELLLRDNDDADIVFADVTKTDDVLNAPATRKLLDFARPIAILGVTLGHYIPPQSDPLGMFTRYRDAVGPGSYLALTHLTNDFAAVDSDEIVKTMKNTQDNVFPRSRDEIMRYFDGFELVEPGMVTTSQWHPDDGSTAVVDPGEDGLWAAVGRKL